MKQCGLRTARASHWSIICGLKNVKTTQMPNRALVRSNRLRPKSGVCVTMKNLVILICSYWHWREYTIKAEKKASYLNIYIVVYCFVKKKCVYISIGKSIEGNSWKFYLWYTDLRKLNFAVFMNIFVYFHFLIYP